MSKYSKLRAAREAEPKLKEGQEVWVRGTLLKKFADDGGCERVDIFSKNIRVATVHPDDIKTEKPL